jgi:pimeloyl-ACP methyl ester carboxylesterase
VRPLPVPLVDDAILLDDGRKLAYAQWGAPTGTPIVFLHGTPGSRRLVPDPGVSAARDIRVITFDRPGYGDSELLPHVGLADVAADVGCLTNRLGCGAFSVVGFSGGGPYALAVGALLADRVRVVALVAGLAPPAVSRASIDGWSDDARALVDLWHTAPDEAARVATDRYTAFRDHVRDWLTDPAAPAADRRILDDDGYLELFVDAYSHALAPGGAGMAWDEGATYKHLPFALRDVRQPVLLFYGGNDSLIKPDDGKSLAEELPHATFTCWPEEAHLGLFPRWGEVLDAVSSATT